MSGIKLVTPTTAGKRFLWKQTLQLVYLSDLHFYRRNNVNVDYLCQKQTCLAFIVNTDEKNKTNTNVVSTQRFILNNKIIQITFENLAVFLKSRP